MDAETKERLRREFDQAEELAAVTAQKNMFAEGRRLEDKFEAEFHIRLNAAYYVDEELLCCLEVEEPYFLRYDSTYAVWRWCWLCPKCSALLDLRSNDISSNGEWPTPTHDYELAKGMRPFPYRVDCVFCINADIEDEGYLNTTAKERDLISALRAMIGEE